ncbi:MAG: hypothetical protein AAFO94_02745 [Bacteroidota bacterium]
MKRTTFLCTILAMSILLLSSCRTRETRTAMKHGEVLKSSIESFESNRQKFSTKVVESLEEAESKLNSESPDLPKVSKDFEKDWSSIQSRYNKLKNDFEDVGKSSIEYFQKLDELSSNINSEQLRNEELAKNKVLKEKWEKTYVEAETSVNKITDVLAAGNDFHMVLVASSIRQKLEQNVSELSNIADQAKSLLKDLEAFTEAGRELVEG